MVPRSSRLVLSFAFALAGCSGDGSAARGGHGAGAGGAGGAPTSATGTGGSVEGSGGQFAAEPFLGGNPTCTEQDEPTTPEACCPSESLRNLPETAMSVLDLTDVAAVAGTCADYALGLPGDGNATLLPLDPAAYPLKIVLPAVHGADPACEAICVPDRPSTAFGVAVATGEPGKGPLIGGNSGRVLAISVPPPWYFVSGGGGEACAWPCLGGYQEYGAARSCHRGSRGLRVRDPRSERTLG